MSHSTLRPSRLRRAATGLAVALALPLTMAASCDMAEDQENQQEQQDQDDEQDEEDEQDDD